mmetsp:Transcript_17024/g.50807  ORF Transcript_17024/g.50807 Transcript_17024/m.50807 type:complete len:95 (-) Transcript_17024:1618-1902(-)
MCSRFKRAMSLTDAHLVTLVTAAFSLGFPRGTLNMSSLEGQQFGAACSHRSSSSSCVLKPFLPSASSWTVLKTWLTALPPDIPTAHTQLQALSA